MAFTGVGKAGTLSFGSTGTADQFEAMQKHWK